MASYPKISRIDLDGLEHDLHIGVLSRCPNVVALVLAWLLLGEALTMAKVVGGGLIVVGLLVIARG